MGFKTFDYVCVNKGCEKYHIKDERFVKDSEQENQFCESCKEKMNKGYGISGIKTNDNSGRMKI